MDSNISTNMAVAIALGVVWEFIWKGLALWRAGRRNESGWFVVLLVVNSFGILPIFYLLTHSKEQGHESK
jgi:hypothetical protein